MTLHWENIPIDRLQKILTKTPKLEIKLEPFKIRGEDKPFQIIFMFYADRNSWEDYRGQGIWGKSRPNKSVVSNNYISASKFRGSEEPERFHCYRK